ncbi:MAG: hypothetical protein WCP20_06585 [Desulfuromonadales bacterium]
MPGIVTIMVLLLCSQPVSCQAAICGLARCATPVLNSPAFEAIFGGTDGSSLKTDRCGQIRELEYIALPGTVFKILEELKRGVETVYRVETEEYPVPKGIRLYVDGRFVEMCSDVPSSRKRSLPTRETIVAALVSSVGSPYVWGGNVRNGVAELSHYFFHNVSNPDRKGLTLAGLDCSGLLYHATAGWTPRNTSQLISFGRPVAIKGKNAGEIVRMLEALDLIVWNGHVLVVLDRDTVIESRLECGKPGNGGVITTPLSRRLQEIMRTRKPVDDWPAGGKQRNVFVVRRWFAERIREL